MGPQEGLLTLTGHEGGRLQEGQEHSAEQRGNHQGADAGKAFQTADSSNMVEPESDRQLELAKAQGWGRCEDDAMILPGQGRGPSY